MIDEEQEHELVPRDALRDYICRCEEVPRSAVQQAISEGNLTLNDIKRRTRAGMGPCQGIYCLRAIALMLDERDDIDIELLEPMNARPPARLIRLGSLADVDAEA